MVTIRDEKVDVTELAARIRLAQEIQITNGPIVAVMEGRVKVTDALRNAAADPWAERPEPGDDAVMRWHRRW